MIYVDTSVVLAQLLAEDRRPPTSLWQEPIVSSRMVEYEVWNRLHARKLGESHGEAARLLIGRLAVLALAPPVLARAMQPFPKPVRTLDALHLASADFLREHGQHVQVASYDKRFIAVASAMKFEIVDL
jgi:predicted nucleic acid-binding protein